MIEQAHKSVSVCSGILKLAVIILVLLVGSIPFRSLSKTPFTEDGYYALTIARNIAIGRGVTIDGSTLTNGFQPLFVFFCVPAYMINQGDKLLSIRIIAFLSVLLLVSTAFLLGSIAKDVSRDLHTGSFVLASWASVLIYLASLTAYFHHFNGLETGLLLFFYTLLWKLFYMIHPISPKRAIAYGSLLGLLVLVRIDAIFFAFIMGLWLILCAKRESALSIPLSIRSRIVNVFLMSGAASLVSFPWWLYNLLGFGSLMPSSGAAQQKWELNLTRLLTCYSAAIEQATPILYFGHYRGLWSDVVRSAAVVALLIYVGRLRSRAADNSAAGVPRAGKTTMAGEYAKVLMLAILALAVWYCLSSYASWFYDRYLSPLLLVSTVGFGLMAGEMMKRFPVGVVGVLMLILPTAWSIGLPHGELCPWEGANITLVRDLVPDKEPVAAGQSGALGYFRENVVNVDGKVNAEAFAFQQKMWEYLAARGIRWFCDAREYTQRYLGLAPEKNGWQKVAERGNTLLYRNEDRKPHREGWPLE